MLTLTTSFRRTFAILLLSSPCFGAGIDPDGNAITISIDTEPPSLDSAIAEDTLSRDLIGLMNEGLVRLDSRLNILPGVAERWEQDGRTVRFFLRSDAVWEDGTPVTAHDFVYAWRRLVNPETGASGSTSYVWMIENGTEILKGELPPDQLGVRAINDRHLEVDLTTPAPFFTEIVAGVPYFPLKQSFVEATGEKFAAEPSRLLANGPFRLTGWVHGASLRFERNPSYWGSDQEISLSSIDVGYVTSDNRTLLNLFKGGDIATFNLTGDTLEDAAESGVQLKQNRRTGCVALITPNLRPERPTSNKRLRQAIQATIDPERLVNRILAVPANQPARSILPSWSVVGNRRLWSAHPPTEPTIDLALGRRHIAAAEAEMGGKPQLTLLAWEGMERQVEYLQGVLGDVGIDVKIDKQSYKQAVAKLIAGEFDISISRFCAGSRDPDFFASIFLSTNPFNDGRFANAEYDELMILTRNTGDNAKRLAAFGRMQQILFDNAVVFPTHEVGVIYAQDDRLANVQRFPNTDFGRAHLR